LGIRSIAHESHEPVGIATISTVVSGFGQLPILPLAHHRFDRSLVLAVRIPAGSEIPFTSPAPGHTIHLIPKGGDSLREQLRIE
jgi:hypothetical protein